MTNWRLRFPDSERISTLVMIVISAIAFVIVYFTGGKDSIFLPLVFLPVMLAVIRCSFETIVALGLILTCIYLFLLGPTSGTHGFSSTDVERALILNAMTLIGGLYARQVRREQVQLRETVDEQEALLDVSQMINAADRLEDALNSALLTLRALLPGFSCAAIFLTDETGRDMVQAASIGAGLQQHAARRLSIGADPPGWSPNDPNLYYVSDTDDQPDAFMARYLPEMRSVACVTLRSLRVPIGMLYVASDRPAAFTSAQIRLLRAFADRIGFPLQRLRLQEGLRDLAFRDPMTGLDNYRAFRSHLHDECLRAERYDHALSLIILDIDHFKEINDRYGHPAGDRMLSGLANTLRATVRATDVPARYGGEEFAIVCPETHVEEALVVAERIRSAVESARFDLAHDEFCSVTCSVGVATYPQDGTTDAILIDAADSALYDAKRAGKNCVMKALPRPQLSPDTTA